jgi:hypothetical protein
MKKRLIYAMLLLVALLPLATYGQSPINRNLTIAGVVMDEADHPLPGVSIYIKNAPGVGTTTNVDGKFTLRVARDETVVFQMVGMTLVEKRIEKSSDELEIVLKEDTQQ